MEFNKAGLQGLVHQGPLRGHVLDGLSEGASLRSLYGKREKERERERERGREREREGERERDRAR